ncbi:TetR/AcrR family transcriptional regulator [Jiangella muralis]|uniref:TetR/AcrR family transcriptional regulator n=1 Tax=Jiangella muralis TaxID=702383 RepID=UPI00069F37A0|nr:TetR/AcrR family transcriptional regulator [Jiangella muralis]
MTRRAEQVEETRQRIVDAAVEVHGTLGPSAGSISAIAERAGVTRLTVYRHFPDDEALFAACSAHWLAGQHPPDPAAWAAIDDPARRLETGLTDLYRFYRDGQPMLTNIYRDKAALPAGSRSGLEANDAAIADLLAAPFDGAAERRRLVRALVGHATSFWTWRSLCVDHDLTQAQAVAAMTDLVLRSGR